MNGGRKKSVVHVHSRALVLRGSWAVDGFFFFVVVVLFWPFKKKLNMNFPVQTLSSVRENNIIVFEKDESTILLLLVLLFKMM